MKRISRIVSLVSLLALSTAPLAITNTVSAQVVKQDLISCDFFQQANTVCDLGIKKEVSVNGGAYVDANSQAEAATAQVGDTITWKVTVTNGLPLTMPIGDVDVSDVLPAGVNFVSAVASTGTYSANVWHFTVGVDGDGYSSNLPATLFITTTAQTVGTVMNEANLAAYYCDGSCSYSDADSSNNSDPAYVIVQTAPQVLGDSTTATPQVLGASTLANTGTGVLASALAGFLIFIALVAATNRKSRKNS